MLKRLQNARLDHKESLKLCNDLYTKR
jgi:hypothetical protein